MNMADQVIVSPNRDAINPELILKITLNVQRYLEIPLDISGILLTEDNKKLADISSKKFENVTKFDINAKTDFQERYTQQEISVILTTNLNEKMLDYIENIRYKNDKGDVNLKLTSRITYLFNKTQISHLYPKNILLPTIETPNKPEKMEILTHQNSQQASSRYTDLWIISGDSNQTMAEVNIFEATKNVKIPASDWVHDYCPVFGIGIFFVFNLPVIESFPKLPVTPSTTANAPATFSEKYNAAIDSLNDMHDKFIEGDWNSTIDKSRPIAELLRNENEIKDLFIRNGYDEDAFKEFNESLKSLFNFASKFHHKLDTRSKKLVADLKATREDAYLIYITSFSVVNAIAQKIKRLEV